MFSYNVLYQNLKKLYQMSWGFIHSDLCIFPVMYKTYHTCRLETHGCHLIRYSENV